MALYGLPTEASFEEVRREVETHYPEIRLGQTPRWPSTSEKRQGKTLSTMVLTVVGQETLKSIGRSRLYLFNNKCTLQNYITFGPRTLCGRCQLYGHPTSRCTTPFPAWAVWAQAHHTNDHPCEILSCKKGLACPHPPVMCVSCQQLHKATDPTCPTFLKLTAQGSPKGKEVSMAEE
jgi:hypothetical protein